MGIVVKNVNKSFKTKHVLKELNLEYPFSNGILGIEGVSGVGKSTLLSILTGIDSPDSGEVIVNDTNLTDCTSKVLSTYMNSKIGIVFQDNNLIEELTVLDNIILPAYINQSKKSELEQKAIDMCNEMKLDVDVHKKVKYLSGGEKQRVSLARALMNSPEVLFADEPTGNLDEENSDMIFRILKEVSKSKMVVIVSHDKDLLKANADYLYILSYGETKLIQQGSTTLTTETRSNVKTRKVSYGNLFTISFKNFALNLKSIFWYILPLVFTIVTFALSNSVREGFTEYQSTQDQQIYNLDLLEVTKENLNPSTPFEIFTDDDLLEFQNSDVYQTIIYKYQGVDLNVIYNGEMIEEIDYQVTNNLLLSRVTDDVDSLSSDEIILSSDIAKLLSSDSLIGEKITININSFSSLEFTVVSINSTPDMNGDIISVISQEGIDSLMESFLVNFYSAPFYNVSDYTPGMSFDSLRQSEISNYIPFDSDDTTLASAILRGSVPSNNNEVIISKTSLLFNYGVLYPDFSNDDIIDDTELTEMYNYVITQDYLFVKESTAPISFKIVGIYDDQVIDNEQSLYTVIVSNDLYSHLTTASPSILNLYVKDVDSIETVIADNNTGKYEFNYPYEYIMTNLQEKSDTTSYILLGLSALFTFIAVLVLNSFMVNYLNTRSKEMAIYRSIGSSKLQINIIMMFEFLFIALFTTLFGMIAYIILNLISNYLLEVQWLYLEFNVLLILYTFVISFILIVISSIRPISKVLNQNPIHFLK